MSGRKRKGWGVAVFLNDPTVDELGWFKASITYPKWKSGFPAIGVSVGDCTRVISLDFDIDSEAGATKEERIRKVKRFRDAVNDFADRAIVAIENAEREKKK